jgi:radical SAM protein with 4Fe4S-binding SPASM domain
MNLKEYLRIVDEFVNLGGIFLLLTGGEPLLRKNILFETIKHARDYMQIERIVVDTNGVLLTEKDAQLFAKYDVDVGVSLDGATPATHDFIRGKGTYDKTIRSIKMLVNEGVKVTTGTTLMKPNFEEVENILRLDKELGVHSANFTLLKVYGRAKENEKQIAPSVDENLSAVKKILETSKEIQIKTSIEEMELGLKKLERAKDLCGAGTKVLSISANGDVYPCDALYFDNLKAGNIRRQKLNEIWKHSPTLKIFKDLSVTRIEKCKDCEIKFICGGGCLADRYALYESFEKCTPMCSIYSTTYWFLISKIAREMWQEIS